MVKALLKERPSLNLFLISPNVTWCLMQSCFAFRDRFFHNSMVESRNLWSHASWRYSSQIFMALRRRQILPMDLAVRGSLSCLYSLASSLFPHCQCATSPEAAKRSWSHDFLQVCSLFLYYLYVSSPWIFSFRWFLFLIGNFQKKLRKQTTYGGV